MKFGHNIYYLSGGTRQNLLGAGCYLFMTLIEAWFSDNPSGKILMGHSAGPSDKNAGIDGVSLHRRKLRTRPVNGVNFQLVLNNRTGVEKYSPMSKDGTRCEALVG